MISGNIESQLTELWTKLGHKNHKSQADSGSYTHSLGGQCFFGGLSFLSAQSITVKPRLCRYGGFLKIQAHSSVCPPEAATEMQTNAHQNW